MFGLQRLHLPLQIFTSRSWPLGGQVDLRFAAAQANRQSIYFGGATCKSPRCASATASRQLIAAEKLPSSDQGSGKQTQQVAYTISHSAVVPEHARGDDQSADSEITNIVVALCQLLPSQFPSATSAKKGVRRGTVLLDGKRIRVDTCALPGWDRFLRVTPAQSCVLMIAPASTLQGTVLNAQLNNVTGSKLGSR